MKAPVITLILFSGLITNIAVASEPGGVINRNYETGLAYTNTDQSHDYEINGSALLPITDYIGTALDADLRHDLGKGNVVDTTRYGVGSSVFLRNFEIGRLGAAYLFSYSKFDLPSSVNASDTSIVHNFRAFGEYYLSNFTISASRTYSHFESGTDRNNWIISGQWYPYKNTKLSIRTSGMDAKDHYGASIEHQPGFFNNAAGLFLSYSYDNKVNKDAFALGFTYYFNTRVHLIDRDRKYR